MKHISITLLAICAASVANFGCSQFSGQDDGNGNSADGSSSFRYVSQYNWQALESVKLPAMLKEETSLALDDEEENLCRKSGYATGFISSFNNATQRTIRELDKKLCNGDEIEVGKIYKEEWGTSHSQLRRFLEIDGKLYRAYCEADSRKANSVQAYQFIDDDRASVQSWYESNSYINYDGFSKFADDPDLIEVVHGYSFDNTIQYFKSSYDKDGEGRSEDYSKYGDREYVSRTIFSNDGGFTVHHDIDVMDGEERYFRDTNFFDENQYHTSRFVAPGQIWALYNKESKIDLKKGYDVPDFPKINDAVNCEGNLIVISCPLQDSKENANSAASQTEARDCDSGKETMDDDERYDYPWRPFEDKYDERGRYVKSIVSLTDQRYHPRVGDVFGVKAVYEDVDGSEVNVSDKVDLNPGEYFEALEVDCSNVSAASLGSLSYGRASTEEEYCALKNDGWILVKAVKANPERVEFEISGRGLTSAQDISVDE